MSDNLGVPPAGVSGDGFRRLHPLTPVLRGWKVFAAAVAIAAQQAYGGLEMSWLLIGIAASIPLGAAYGYLAWRSTHYRVDAEALRLETGVLSKRSRRVRLDRLQAVDVVRPLVARVLGLAELRLEVAGGSSSEAPLAYLSEENAQRLRAELLARAAGLHHETPEAPEAAGPADRGDRPVGRRDRRLRVGRPVRGRGDRAAGVVAVRHRGAVRARLHPGHRRCGGAELRLHGRRVTGRPAVAARPAGDPVADRAAGPGAA